jgi:deazaflavin-dependent oxidoreductase (nitroreductase family)
MADYEWFIKAHRYVYHHTAGWIGGNLGGIPMVLMYTIGAKTGQVRMVPLQYYPKIAPEGILVLASNNGQPKAPNWYYNLKAHPDIDIRVGRERRRVHAEELGPERHEAVWPAMRRQNNAIETYARKAGRTLPIMLLRTVRPPAADSASAGQAPPAGQATPID